MLASSSLPTRREERRRLTGAPLSGADVVLVGLATLLLFGVYRATMYPGLHAQGDAAKFAYVGKVLGTPHAPGYPLYMLVSHAFSYLPWGTLAFRMNLLSVVLAVTAAVFVYFILRRLGTSRVVAVSIMLAFGFGNSFWSRALYAKGYTLNAALVAAGTLLLLRWGQTKRLSLFYWAVAVFALSTGNHLIVVSLVPALVLFALATDARTVLRPHTIACVALMVLAGLCQYSYILIRTWQKAPYLEARAENLSQLWAVMTARRFAHEIGAFTFPQLLDVRVPKIWGLIAGEFGVAGLALVCLGTAVLIAQRRREVILLVLGGLGVAALTTNMSSNEDRGFLLPTFVLLWPVAGVGLDWAFGVVARAPRAVAATVTLAAAVLLPATQVARNYSENDRHTDTFETVYCDALFAALPQKAAIINDEYILTQLMIYKILGEGAAGTREIRLIPDDRESVAKHHDEGYEVLAFRSVRNQLTHYGFVFAPFDIPATGTARDVVRQRPIYRLTSAPACVDIGDRAWADVTESLRPKGQASVTINNFRPFESSVTIYVATQEPATPAVIATGGRGSPSLAFESFSREDPDARQRLLARASDDNVVLPDAILAASYVTRLLVRVDDGGASSTYSLDLRSPSGAARAKAVVDLVSPKRAVVCSHPLSERDGWPADAPHVVFTPDGSTLEFPRGWWDLEQDPTGRKFRWTMDRAMVLLPLDHPRAATLTMEVWPFDYPGRRDDTLTLVINGHRLAPLAVPARRSALSWHVGAEHWRRGLNEIVLEVPGARRPYDTGVSGDGRVLGVSLTEMRLTAADATKH